MSNGRRPHRARLDREVPVGLLGTMLDEHSNVIDRRSAATAPRQIKISLGLSIVDELRHVDVATSRSSQASPSHCPAIRTAPCGQSSRPSLGLPATIALAAAVRRGTSSLGGQEVQSALLPDQNPK
jgi:hypothetical protein